MVFIAGVFIWREFSFYKDFDEVIEPQVNEESDILHAQVNVYDTEDIPERIKSLRIDNEEEILEILDHFAHLELKKDPDARLPFGGVTLSIATSNPTGEDYIQTDSFDIRIGEDYMAINSVGDRNSGYYEILNDESNHMEFLEAFDEEDWEYDQ